MAYVPSKYEYTKRNYDRVSMMIPKGALDKIKELAQAENKSINRYILEAVEQKSGLKLTLDNALPWIKKEQGEKD